MEAAGGMKIAIPDKYSMSCDDLLAPCLQEVAFIEEWDFDEVESGNTGR